MLSCLALPVPIALPRLWNHAAGPSLSAASPLKGGEIPSPPGGGRFHCDVASNMNVQQSAGFPARRSEHQYAHLSQTISLSRPIRNETIHSRNPTIPRNHVGCNSGAEREVDRVALQPL